MDDLAIIDRFTETFSRYIDSGFGLLAGDVAFLTSVLVAIDITLAGLFWALMGEDNVPAQLIKKVLYIGFFALLLNNFKGLADIIFQSFAGLGLKASGASLTAADLMRPGFVASTGFTASRPLLEKAGELVGITSFFTNFVTIVVLMLAWLIVLLAFFVLSVQLFITIIEFKLTVLAGFVLVPFALFGHTAFLAERVLGNVISSGIKLMVLTIVVGIGTTLFGVAVRPAGEITLTQAASCILAAIAVFGFAVFIPALAAGLVSGAPQLGAGAAVATTAALGGTAIAGAMLASGAARLTGRATGASVQTAAALTGRVGAAYEAGGPRGVASTTVTAPASRLIASGSAPVRDAYRQGAAQGYRDAGSGPGSSDGGSGAMPGGSPSSEAPAWAQSLARRQRLTQAGLLAAGAIREGDRSAGGGGPDLKDKS
ncbi:MAG TPA: P-type conjugative transfer protein TrbL [Hyphomicrobiaceae bacterium]|nr:P-type conjugative transfer protein TrbL [Hyphomicrobiaceae bacterium]